MNGKRSVKKSERNTPVRKSLRLRKAAEAPEDNPEWVAESDEIVTAIYEEALLDEDRWALECHELRSKSREP